MVDYDKIGGYSCTVTGEQVGDSNCDAQCEEDLGWTQNTESTCTGDWDFMRTDGINCCAPGFMGARCDTCIPPLMKINDACVKCEAEGLASINWSGMVVGVAMAFGFTIFLMRKAAMTLSLCRSFPWSDLLRGPRVVRCAIRPRPARAPRGPL